MKATCYSPIRTWHAVQMRFLDKTVLTHMRHLFLMLKVLGGEITLAEGTAFAYGGDLNLVGLAQPLSTLVNGDIQDVGTYGPGGSLDWDNTALTDQISLQSEARMDYTWRNDFGQFPPGKLDFMIYSDAVMSAEHSFILRTEDMSVSRLNEFNLNQNDTDGASDHLPVTVDFAIPLSTSACPAPFALNTSDISSSGATLSWIERWYC